MPTPPVSGTISAAGNANAVVLPIAPSDTEALVVVNGTFTGCYLYFEATRDTSNPPSVWFPVLAVRASDYAVQPSDGATPGVALADGTSRAWRVLGLELCTQVRVWAYALTGGSLAVQMSAGSFFASGPISGSAGLGLWQLQVLFQLEQIKLALYWLKEPSGSREPALAGGELWSFLGNPGQSFEG